MTTYDEVRLRLSIMLESGLHIGTGFGVAKLLDERTTRGPHSHPTYAADLPYIPGASLKGRLRMAAEALHSTLGLPDVLIDDLFGTARNPGRLTFPDAYLVRTDELLVAQPADPSRMQQTHGALVPYLAMEERTHVALSRERRNVREEMLMRIEVTSPGFSFETTIEGWLPQAQARRGLALLVAAALATTHVGGHKGRGLGAVQIRPVFIEHTRRRITVDDVKREL